MNRGEIETYLKHTSEVYEDLGGEPLEVVICGGTALNLSGLIDRPTKDVDVIAPDQWSETFQRAVLLTQRRFGLPPTWMNNGPADLMRMGLPDGFWGRCLPLRLGGKLTYLLASRFDQIHFKLYASVDRRGYHVTDLKALSPSEDELFKAALWTFTHDVSEEFRKMTIEFLKQTGWSHVAKRLER